VSVIEVPLNIFAWLPDRGRFRPSTMKKNEV
jgi:hypothetical protein